MLRSFLTLLLTTCAIAITALAIRGSSDTLFRKPVPLAGRMAQSGDPIRLTIRPGEDAEQIARRLAETGVISDRNHFRVLVRLMGVEGQLQAGDYTFEPNLPLLEVITRLHLGITSPLLVTIPEGLRVEEIAVILERAGVTDRAEFLAALREQYDAPYLKNKPPGTGLEGYLFPATYGFSPKTPGREVVQKFLETFEKQVMPAAANSTSSLTLHEALTLASIIEREAVVPEERPQIASVYLNRLRRGMPLQADPTVQYALAQEPASVQRFGFWKRELTELDLKVDSPYNTYKYNGLPPGPIANPGLASILAALRPAHTNYLYFMARPDGSHAFAETWDEHIRNVNRYQP